MLPFTLVCRAWRVRCCPCPLPLSRADPHLHVCPFQYTTLPFLYRDVHFGLLDLPDPQRRLSLFVRSIRSNPDLGALVNSLLWDTHSNKSCPATTSLFDSLALFPNLNSLTFKNWSGTAPPAPEVRKPAVESLEIEISDEAKEGVGRPDDWLDLNGLRTLSLTWSVELPLSWNS